MKRAIGVLAVVMIMGMSVPATAGDANKCSASTQDNGVKFSEDNEKQLKDIKYSMTPGADFTYTVSRKGSKVDLDIELGKLPDDVKAQWVGSHMMDHAELQMASKE